MNPSVYFLWFLKLLMHIRTNMNTKPSMDVRVYFYLCPDAFDRYVARGIIRPLMNLLSHFLKLEREI